MNQRSEKLTFFCQLCNSRIEGNICPEHGIDFVTIKKVSVAESAEAAKKQDQKRRINGMLQIDGDEKKPTPDDRQIAVDGQNDSEEAPFLPVIQTETGEDNSLTAVSQNSKTNPQTSQNASVDASNEADYVFARDAEFQELDDDVPDYYSEQAQTTEPPPVNNSEKSSLVFAVLAIVFIMVATGIYFVAYYNPETAGTIYSRAESYFSTAQYEEALVLYQQIVSEYPDDPLAEMASQRIERINPQSEGAAELSEEQQQQVQAFIVKANMAFQNQQFLSPESSSALYFLNRTLAMDPQNSAALDLQNKLVGHFDNLANIAINEQDYDRALAHYQNILKVNPGSDDVLKKMRSVLEIKSTTARN